MTSPIEGYSETEPVTALKSSQRKGSLVWRRLKRNGLGLAALTAILLLVLTTGLADWLSPHRYDAQSACLSQPPGYCQGQLFLFGTDQLGQDLFARTLKGGQTTLFIAFSAVLINLLLAILLGSLSGYLAGMVDFILQRIVEILMAIPRLALLMAVAYIIESYTKGDYWSVYLGIVGVLALVNWAPQARIVRGRVLALREEEYIMAARAGGAGDLHIMLKHILPNLTGLLIVMATLALPDIIILESILSFLGLGVQEPWISWGLLLQQETIPNLAQFWWYLSPVFLLFLTITALSFLGDALRDLFDLKAQA